MPVESDPMKEEEGPAGSSSGEAFCSNRAELIERLKKGEAPQWIPNQSVRDTMQLPGILPSLKFVPLPCPARDGTTRSVSVIKKRQRPNPKPPMLAYPHLRSKKTYFASVHKVPQRLGR